MPVINPSGVVPTPTGGPCAAWSPLCVDFPENPTPEEQMQIDNALMAATEVLWARTKQQFGVCTMTLRPCHEECGSNFTWTLARFGWQNATGWTWPFPALVGGQWFNFGCGDCSGGCSCGHAPSTLRLPFPLVSVTEVLIDGQELDPNAYVVYNQQDLVRTDGGSWPRCNDLGSDDTEPGTWSVTAEYGIEPPILARQAVGQLATQIFKSCTGAAGCVIPTATVREVTRQGVKKVFFDADSAFQAGRIGLYYTDLFISTYNPSGWGMTSIFNIDGPRRQQVTWVPGM